MIFTIPLDKHINKINISTSSPEGDIGAIHCLSDQSIHFTGSFPENLYPLVYTEGYSNNSKLHGCVYPSNTIKTIGDQYEVDHHVDEKMDVRLLLINIELLKKHLHKLFGDTDVISIYADMAYHINDEDIEMYINIHDRILNNENIPEEELSILLSNIFKEPIMHQLHFEKGYELIQKAISLMKEHLKEPILISDLSRLLDVSNRTLGRSFKKHLNISPKLYYKRLLLLTIESELRNAKEISVTHVINDYQIYNLSQFGASFKDCFNMTPSEILNLNLNNNPFGWNEKVFSEFIED